MPCMHCKLFHPIKNITVSCSSNTGNIRVTAEYTHVRGQCSENFTGKSAKNISLPPVNQSYLAVQKNTLMSKLRGCLF
jgi:hypothetical protein